MMKKMFILVSTALYLSCISGTYAVEQAKEKSGDVDLRGDRGGASKAYGQLSISSANINFNDADTWVLVPFSAVGPKAHMGLTKNSPAKATIKRAGAYQLSMSVYFSVEASQEDTFDSSTYTLGVSVNDDTVMPVAAVHVTSPGSVSLNFSQIMQLAEQDNVKFYMKASVVGFGFGYTNVITLENGNAYLMRIAS